MSPVRVIEFVTAAAKIVGPFINLPESVKAFYPEAGRLIEEYERLVTESRAILAHDDVDELERRLVEAMLEVTGAAQEVRQAAHDRAK